MKNVFGNFIKWLTKKRLLKKYATHLQMPYGLSINTPKGCMDFSRIMSSKYLISQGVEPTEENIMEFHRAAKFWVDIWDKNRPRKQIVHMANNEEEEALSILMHQRVPKDRLGMIKRVYSQTSVSECGRSQPNTGLMVVYLMGKIDGVRAERLKRRSKLKICG